MSADSPHPSALQSSQAGQSGSILVVALWFGLVAGLGIVILAIVLDRVSKAALQRINRAHKP